MRALLLLCVSCGDAPSVTSFDLDEAAAPLVTWQAVTPSAVAFAEDGASFVVAGVGGFTHVRGDVRAATAVRIGGEFVQIRYAGDKLYTWDASGAVVFDPETGARLNPPAPAGIAVIDASAREDVAAVISDRGLEMRDTWSNATLSRWPAPGEENLSHVALGERVVAVAAYDAVYLLDRATLATLHAIALPEGVFTLALNERHLLVTGWSGALSLIDVASGQLVRTEQAGFLATASWSTDGAMYVVTDATGAIVLHATTTGQTLSAFTQGEGLGAAAVHGKQLVSVQLDSGVVREVTLPD